MRRKRKDWKYSGKVLLFVFPALIPLTVFWIYPILRSLFISFTNWDYMSPTYDFVFLDNFIALFHDSRFYDALLNTLLFTLGTLIPTLIGGLLLALLLQRNFRGSGIYKFILFSPWVTPTVAISIVWVWIFELDTEFGHSTFGCYHCYGMEEYRVRNDFLPFRIGKGSGRTV